MSEPIRILHVTDLHMRKESVPYIDARVKAFGKYVTTHGITADIICFTGDLTWSGTEEELTLARSNFLTPIRGYLRTPEKNIVIIPGNHDVDRTKINIAEHTKLRRIANNQDAEKILVSAVEQWPRFEAFRKFTNDLIPGHDSAVQYKSTDNGFYSARIVSVRGVSVGIAALNSSWLCGDDADEGNLFLTERQVRQAAEFVDRCHLKVALLHHPYTWYHPSENELTLSDLRRKFDVIATGHLHTPDSVFSHDANSKSIFFTGRAFFEGKEAAKTEDGFHLYEVDLPGRRVIAKFRKYMRKRDTFDADNEHAQNGQEEFPLHITETIFTSGALIAQKLATTGNQLQADVRRELALLQGTENPVFVTPKLTRFRFDDGSRKRDNHPVPLTEVLAKSGILFGGPDSGKTVLMKTLVGDNQADRATGISEKFAVYLDLSHIQGDLTNEMLITEIRARIDQDPLATQSSLALVVDGFKQREYQNCLVVHHFCQQQGWTYLVAIGSSIVAEALAQETQLQDGNFFEVLSWGPSRIRELAVKLFQGTKMDVNQAYKFVTRCLKDCDLPATPTYVSLYMSVFPKLSDSASSISFLRLLEKIEQLRLGTNEDSSVNSLYNRSMVLRRLATACMRDGDILLPTATVTSLVEAYFLPSFLKVDTTNFIDQLCEAGILIKEEQRIGFRHFVFYDYYLALALQSALIDEIECSSNLFKCIRISQALSLYAGLSRDNENLAHRVIGSIREKFPSPVVKTLGELDKYISYLIHPATEGEVELEQTVNDDLATNVNYDELDEGHERERSKVVARRRNLISGKQELTLDDLSAQIEGLYAFYTIFRNLENIKGASKVDFLNNILDYHVKTNFYLIDFAFSRSQDESFRSFAAYMATWSGHRFMAAWLGNPSMGDAIKQAIKVIDNDFKKFLLVLLLSDLHDRESLKYIESFLKETSSFAATEIIYLHLRQRMVLYDKLDIPANLIAVFKTAFFKRERLYKKKTSLGEITDKYNSMIKKTKSEHWVSYHFKTEEGISHIQD